MKNVRTRTKVIVINGLPQSGKDSFATLVQSYCNMDESANVLNLSSVDPIKEVLEQFGWDGEKSAEVRDIIAGIKQIWIGAQNGPTMYMMNNILEWHKSFVGEDNIVFCHIREPEEINKLVNAINGMSCVGIDIMTILMVRGNHISEHVNDRLADSEVSIVQYPYDMIIYNDAGLPELDEKAIAFVDELLK